MKTTPKVNKLANILKTYSILNVSVGLMISVYLWITELYFSEAFAQFADYVVASVAIYALGEIIQLLHTISLNTANQVNFYGSGKTAPINLFLGMRNCEPSMSCCPSLSYQIRMILYCLFDSLWLDTDVPLRGTGTTMLQQPLHKV